MADGVEREPQDRVDSEQIDPFAEIGRSGLRHWGGLPYEEFLPQLQGERFYRVMREMTDNDSTVGAIMLAIDQLMRKAEWEARPPDELVGDAKAQEAAAFVQECLHDMSSTWHDTLGEIQSMLPMGWSFHEIVLKRRMGGGENDPAETRSKFDDGRIGWRKLPIRAQETRDQWDLDDAGGIRGMWQSSPPDYRRRYLPMQRGLLFRTTTAKGNPEGRSVLRNAWHDWYFKKRIQTIEGIGVERDLAGLPVGRVPYRMLTSSATESEKAALVEMKKILRNIRQDDQAAILWPSQMDEHGHDEYDLKLMSTGGSRQFDTDAIITRYDQRMAMTVLADFILLGHSKVGTQSLSVSKIELFTMALRAWMDSIAEVFNRYAIPRLMRANGMDPSLSPILAYSAVEQVDFESLATYLKTLADAGMPLFPDEELEKYLRLIVPGLPPPPVVKEGEEDLRAAAPRAGLVDDEVDEAPSAPTEDDEIDDSADVDDSDDE